MAFYASNAAAATLIVIALHLWGAAEIRNNPAEQFFLAIVGVFWVVLTPKLFGWLGLSYHDDVIGRRNPAALLAICGALIGLAILYAGGSIGEGPSYSNNVFSVGLATAGWLGLWVSLEIFGDVSRSITEERDAASGLRLGGFLLATALILGRAVAGDWHSAGATISDFVRDGWPAAVLGMIAPLVERAVRPRRHRLFPSWPTYGLAPALSYLLFAGVWLWHLGVWEGFPK